MKLDFEFYLNQKFNNNRDAIWILEGEFIVKLDNKNFLSVNHFLLLEFSLFLLKWFMDLKKNEIYSFYYQTMDSEEEPILTFINVKNGFIVKSIWENFISKRIIPSEEIYFSVESFLQRMIIFLDKNYNINLENLIFFDTNL